MTHHPIVAQALYYYIVEIVPTPQQRKPLTCNNMNTRAGQLESGLQKLSSHLEVIFKI
jgi:hypothetical protein